MSPSLLKAGRRFSCVATLISACAVPQFATASCVQSDVEGRWRVYATVSEPESPHWMNCDLTMTSEGVISGGSCDSPGQRNLKLSSGEIKVADTINCVFAGFFELEGTPNRVEHATLSPEKTVASGVGAFARGFFSFTMIKTSNP